MEFKTIKSHGYVLHVVSNNDKYIFFTDGCGIVAIAEKQKQVVVGLEHFIIKYGNNNLKGGLLGNKGFATAVRRHVTKSEKNKNNNKMVKFTYEWQPLEQFYAEIIVKRYGCD